MNPNGYDNPLGSFGVTNRDYAGVVATAMAESSVNAPLEEMQGIVDVIANRLENARAYGAKTTGAYGVVSGQFGGWAQFDPWGGVAPGTRPQGSAHANKTLREGLKAALNPNYAETLPDALKDKRERAQTAVMSVMGSQVARGISKGATTFSGSNVQLSANRSKEHGALGLGNATKLGGTSFYGKGHDATAEFNINQNIETQVAQDVPVTPADTYFGDVMFGEKPVDPVPIGQVTASSIPDITPAREAGFSLEDFSPIGAAPVDFSGVRQGMTEQQAIDAWGLQDQHPASDVEVRYGSRSFGDDIDRAVAEQLREEQYADNLVANHGVLSSLPGGIDYATDWGGYVGAPAGDFLSAPFEDHSAITAGILHDGQMSQNTFNDVFDAGFPMDSFTPVDAAPVDFSGVHIGMTEQQAVDRMIDPRFSENVEVRPSDFGISIDDRINSSWKAEDTNDYLAAQMGAQIGGIDLDPTSFTTDPYESLPGRPDMGVWGGSTPFDDRINVAEMASPTFQDYEEGRISTPTGISPLGAAGMGERFGVDLDRDYSDITAGIFSDKPQAPAPAGFAAGFGDGPWGATPDFSAPSLERRNAEAFNQSAVKDLQSDIRSLEQSIAANELANGAWNEMVASSPTLGSFDTTKSGIRDQEAEFGIPRETNPFDVAFAATPDLGTFGSMPSMASLPGPSLAPAPIETVTAPTATASVVPQGDFDEFGANFPGATAAPQRASAPAPQRAAPSAPQSFSLPSAPAPASTLPDTAPLPPSRQQLDMAKQFDLPSFDLPSFDLPDIGLPTARDIGTTIGLSPGFMDGVGNFMDSRLGKATTGAATGFLTGGPIGAVTSGIWGGLGIGDRLASEWDRYANAYANLSPQDFAMFGLDGNWTDREPTFDTGMTGGYDGRGGGNVGDGSFSSSSGRNENNPQGIL